jgi:hypothetical protein
MRTFAFRNGELFSISFDPAGEESRYVVAVIDLPDLPGTHPDLPGTHAEGGSQAVVAAEQLDGVWHWLHLEPATKQEIGEHMECYGIGSGWHELSIVTNGVKL